MKRERCNCWSSFHNLICCCFFFFSSTLVKPRLTSASREEIVIGGGECEKWGGRLTEKKQSVERLVEGEAERGVEGVLV